MGLLDEAVQDVLCTTKWGKLDGDANFRSLLASAGRQSTLEIRDRIGECGFQVVPFNSAIFNLKSAIAGARQSPRLLLDSHRGAA